MVDKGLLQILVKALITGDKTTFEHILWTLCNIIGEVSEYKLTLYEQNIYNIIFEQYSTLKCSSSTYGVFAWFISNSLKGQPRLSYELVD